MPTGTNDFNQPIQDDPTSPGQGIAQTGNRLLMGGGSNSASGRWIFADGFEDGLAAWIAPSAASIETTTVYQGAKSCKISTMAVNGNTQEIRRYFFAQGSRFGVEMYFSFGFAGPMEIQVGIEGPYKDSGKRGSSAMILDILGANSGNLYVYANASTTLVSSVNDYLLNTVQYWHYVKFSFDPKNNKVIRGYFDDLIFNFGEVPGLNLGASNDKYVLVYIKIKTKSANIATMILDNIVITADEP